MTAAGLLLVLAVRALWVASRPSAQRWEDAKLPPLSQSECRAAPARLTATQKFAHCRLLSNSGRIEYRSGFPTVQRTR